MTSSLWYFLCKKAQFPDFVGCAMSEILAQYSFSLIILYCRSLISASLQSSHFLKISTSFSLVLAESSVNHWFEERRKNRTKVLFRGLWYWVAREPSDASQGVTYPIDKPVTVLLQVKSQAALLSAGRAATEIVNVPLPTVPLSHCFSWCVTALPFIEAALNWAAGLRKPNNSWFHMYTYKGQRSSKYSPIQTSGEAQSFFSSEIFSL